jgi:hypothetical protein
VGKTTLFEARNISHSSLETFLEVELLIVVDFPMKTCSGLLREIIVPIYEGRLCEDAFDSFVNGEGLIWMR